MCDKVWQEEGSKLAKNSVTYFMDKKIAWRTLQNPPYTTPWAWCNYIIHKSTRYYVRKYSEGCIPVYCVIISKITECNKYILMVRRLLSRVTNRRNLRLEHNIKRLGMRWETARCHFQEPLSRVDMATEMKATRPIPSVHCKLHWAYKGTKCQTI